MHQEINENVAGGFRMKIVMKTFWRRACKNHHFYQETN